MRTPGCPLLISPTTLRNDADRRFGVATASAVGGLAALAIDFLGIIGRAGGLVWIQSVRSHPIAPRLPPGACSQKGGLNNAMRLCHLVTASAARSVSVSSADFV